MDIEQIITPGKDTRQLYFNNDNSRVEIYQNQEHTWLMIDGIVQSAINNQPPFRPVLPHSLVMLLPLIHDVKPQSILELGGGGLSTQRYVRTSFPQIEFISCELNQGLTDTVRACFPGSESLTVVTEDAHALTSRFASQQKKFDWVMIDLYDGGECAIEHRQQLLKDCQIILSEGGWLIFNHLSAVKHDLDTFSDELTEMFSERPYVFAVPGMQNHIFMLRVSRGLYQNEFSFPAAVDNTNLNR